MSKSMTLNVRVTGPLGEFVAAQVGEDGAYENVSEYVRALIRQDMAQADSEAFARLKAELTLAFSAPDETYHALTADEVIRRNLRRAS